MQEEEQPTESLIFHADDRAIKFFIQKDLDHKVVEQLQNQVTRHGGRVESKVPLQGFLLIDPDSPEGQRLIECWDVPERPKRNFVPLTFVDACLDAGKLIPQVFRKDGVSLRIYIHQCITSQSLINNLTSCILHSGGRVGSEFEANIIVADEDWAGFHDLVERYDHHHKKYVEGVPWIEECIESGIYKNTPVVKKNLGGRIPGSRRTEFTPEDDKHLAGYIAARLPESTMRGRTGNKLYQDLCSKPDLYSWAQRHPWQSWRERYKNNVPRFHKLITAHLALHPAPVDGKGLHGFVRVPSSTPKINTQSPGASKEKSERNAPGPSNGHDRSDDEWGGSQWDVREGKRSPPVWGKGNGKRKALTEDRKTWTASEDPDSHINKKTKIDNSKDNLSSIEADLIPPSMTEEYVNMGEPIQINAADGNNESSQTQSSGYGMNDIGSETQTLLDANRNLVGLANGDLPHFDNFDKGSGGMERAPTPGIGIRTQGMFHSDIHLALDKIASEYHFLFDEVEEVYREANGDIAITKQHFQDIRTYISEKRKEIRMRG